jgi:hypothetical protein
VPVDEALRMVTLYETRYTGWTVKHFHERKKVSGTILSPKSLWHRFIEADRLRAVGAVASCVINGS